MCLLMATNPWTSIHHYEYALHPYRQINVRLITENVPYHLTHVVYGFLPHWRADFTDQIRPQALSHVAWFSIELDSVGYIKEYNGWPMDWTDLRLDVQGSGTRFDLTVTCFDWSGAKVHNLISNPENRRRAIDNILEESKDCDGVNIDFERPAADDRDTFSAFLEELSDSLHEHGMSVSVDVTAVNWGERFDAARIAHAVDYVFIMGYDFHWSGSSQSGPVAPLEGETYNVTRSADYYIEESGGLGGKLILGVPYYGYDWPTKTISPYSTTEGGGTAYIYSSAATRGEEHGIAWHEPTSSPWYHYTSEDQIRQCWFENTESLSSKYDLAKDRNLAGVGIWALTYDAGKEELWNLISAHFSTGILEEPGEIKTNGYASILTRRKLNRYLKDNQGFEIYDVNGRMLEEPVRGVIFLKTEGTVTKVVVTR